MPWLLAEQGPRDNVNSLEVRLAGLGTHKRLWPAAQSFARFLEETDLLRDQRVLELGSGTGWLGATVLENAGCKALTLTDLPHVVPDLRARRCRAGGPGPGPVRSRGHRDR